MRNIQVIDGAINAAYDIFAASEADFSRIFPKGQDVAFIDEVLARHKGGRKALLDAALARIWKRRIKKSNALGIHGLLFYQLTEKKAFYPTRRDEEAINPNGSPLR